MQLDELRDSCAKAVAEMNGLISTGVKNLVKKIISLPKVLRTRLHR